MEEKRSFPGSHDVSELLKKHSHRSFVGDNPRWSLVDGSLRYSLSLPSFSGGRPLSCSLIYDSDMPYPIKESFKGLPERFKISCFALMIECQDSFAFISEQGDVILFLKYIDQGDVFYHDDEGLGLIYDPNQNRIDDGFGNALFFDDQYRLIKKSFSDEYIISYQYGSDGYLESIQDETGRKRRIVFSYFSGKLSAVTSYYGSSAIQTMAFHYSKKVVGNTTVLWQLTSVSRISSEKGHKEEPVLLVTYAKQAFREEPQPIEFDDISRMTAFRITYNAEKPSKISSAPFAPKVAFKEKYFSEKMNETKNTIVLKNELGLSLAYMLDEKGYCTSAFEQEESGTLSSLSKQDGILLAIDQDNIGVDSLPYKTCVRNFPVRLTECIQSGTGERKALSEARIDLGTSLSVYVRLKESAPGAVISATGFISAALDPYAIDVWQKVVLGSKTEGRSDYINIIVTNDLGVAIEADIYSPTIVKAATERIEAEGEGFCELHQLSRNGERIRGVVSLSDIVASFQYYLMTDSVTRFLFMNGGIDMIDMSEVSFTLGDREILFTDFFNSTTLSIKKYDKQTRLIYSRALKKNRSRAIEEESQTTIENKEIITSEKAYHTINNESWIDSVGVIHSNQYSGDGLLLKKFVGEKIAAEFRYDSDGNEIIREMPTLQVTQTFENGRLSSTTDRTMTKKISYDGFGKTSSVTFGNGLVNRFEYQGTQLVSMMDDVTKIAFPFNPTNDSQEFQIGSNIIEQTKVEANKSQTKYPGNSEIVSFFDKYRRVQSIGENGGRKAIFGYDSRTSNLTRIDDEFSGTITEISRMADGSIRKALTTKDGKVHVSRENIYGGNVVEYVVGKGSLPYRKSIIRKKKLISIKYDRQGHTLDRLGGDTFLDEFGRPIEKQNTPVGCSYTYVSPLSPLIAKMKSDDFTEELQYQTNGFRITKAVFTGEIAHTDSYQYDQCGRLQSASRSGTHSYSHLYSYRGSRLVKVTNSVELIRNSDGTIQNIIDVKSSHPRIELSYDNLGNVTKYGSMKLTYECGHRLSGIQGENISVGYRYAYDGTRTEKTINGKKTIFYYDGSVLLGEDRDDGTRIRYFRDNDSYTGFTIEKENYRTFYGYIKDASGSVLGLVDSQGYIVGTYVYDERGTILEIDANKNISDSKEAMELNPIRYRGYYYDTETGFYYLMSRYYNPLSLSFLTPDEKEYVDGCSIPGVDPYCYCCYDPVNFSDATGHIAEWLIALIAGAIAGVIIGGTYGGITAAAQGASGWQIVGAIRIGALTGGIMGAGAGFGSSVITNGIASIAKWSVKALLIGLSSGAVSGAVGGFANEALMQTMYHGHVNDWASVWWSALQAAGINTIAMFASTIGGGAGCSLSDNLCLSLVTGFPISAVSFTIDMFRYYDEERKKRQRRKALMYGVV